MTTPWTSTLPVLAILLAPLVARAQEPPEEPKKPAPEKKAAVSGDERARKLLDERTITASFRDAPLEDALEAVRTVTGVDVVVDPAVDAKAKFDARLERVPARAALERVLGQLPDLAYEHFRGTVFVTRKSSPRPAPPAAELTRAAREAVAERKVTVNFPEVALADVVQFLGDMTGLPFRMEEGFEVTVTAKLHDLPLGDALDVLCRLAGARIESEGEVNVFKRR